MCISTLEAGILDLRGGLVMGNLCLRARGRDYAGGLHTADVIEYAIL